MADKIADPVVAFKFGLEISGKLSGYFTSVSGIGSETEVITQKLTSTNGNEPIIKQIPGRLTWTPITLRRGVTDLKDVWDWRQMVVEGKIEDARVNASIIAYSQSGEPVAQWDLENAWPSQISGPEMASDSTDFMVEEITIVHEGMTRVK
jgi:phage tail-like protein